MTDNEHVLWIVWGEAPEEGARAEQYLFATEAERDAFLRGVEAAQGWLDYRVVDSDGYINEAGEFVRA